MACAQTVLVLDDELELREDLAELLMAAGYAVEAFGDARAITDAHLANFDALLLDLAMPGSDGIAVLDRLSRLQKAPRVVFMSGHGEDVLQTVSDLAVRARVKVAGVLHKPLSGEDLLRVLKEPAALPGDAEPLSWTDEQICRALEEAIARKALSVSFQPKVTTSGLMFAGAEALLTGELPGLGKVSPETIVAAAATDVRLLEAMTLDVLRQSADACRLWVEAGWDVPVSVNLPFEVLRLPSSAERLLSPIEAAGLRSRHVIFELTEDAIYDSSRSALALLTRLRLAGFGLSLDDVGRRQSGLLQLANLPITEVKIDLQLLAQARAWAKSRRVFGSLAELGHRLGLTVVAEGVETSDDLVLVRSLPVDYVQGYFVSRKRSLPDLLAMLAISSPKGALVAPDHAVPTS